MDVQVDRTVELEDWVVLMITHRYAHTKNAHEFIHVPMYYAYYGELVKPIFSPIKSYAKVFKTSKEAENAVVVLRAELKTSLLGNISLHKKLLRHT